jgi:large subunit ribosomal protein L20
LVYLKSKIENFKLVLYFINLLIFLLFSEKSFIRLDKKVKKMTRVKRGVVARKRRKKILNLTKGFRGAASKLFRTANQRYMKALKLSYVNRRKKKRDFRSLWISRLNAAARKTGLNYNLFIFALKNCNIQLNRKILSQLSINDPQTFQSLYQTLQPLLIINIR